MSVVVVIVCQKVGEDGRRHDAKSSKVKRGDLHFCDFDDFNLAR